MTTAIDPVETVRLYHDAINALDFDAISAYFAEDAVYASDGVGALEGRDAILAAFRVYFAEFPDQVAADELIEAVSPLAARSVWRLTATSRATGKTIERSGEEVVTLRTDGRIVKVEVSDD